MKNAKKYGGILLMKNKILALVLAGTMLFGQNVYATELVTCLLYTSPSPRDA